MAVPLSREKNAPPIVRVRTPEGTARVLRTHFTRHNWKVLGIAFGTLLASVAAWMLLYVASYSVLVFVLAVLDPDHEQSPRGFGTIFAVAGLCAMAYAWIDRRLTPNTLPNDKKSPGELLAECVLLVPRMTLSVGGTLAAWQRLDDADLTQAAALLHRLAEEKRIPMSSIRLQIPDPTTAMRVLFALQLTEVVDVHRDGSEFWLKLNALRPAALRMGRGDFADA
jgi:hypothetical protein